MSDLTFWNSFWLAVLTGLMGILGVLIGLNRGSKIERKVRDEERARKPIEDLHALIRSELMALADDATDGDSQRINKRDFALCVNRIGTEFLYVRGKNPQNWEQVEKCYKETKARAQDAASLKTRDAKLLLIALREAVSQLEPKTN